jgi:hypothetical protein
MAALTERRLTKRRDGKRVSHPVAAGAVIHEGALVVLDGGYAKPAHEASGLYAAGVAGESADNGNGANGAEAVVVIRGVFAFASAGDITRAQIGAQAYMVDDQTVSASDNSGARSAAGKIIDVNEDGVWVEIG